MSNNTKKQLRRRCQAASQKSTSDHIIVALGWSVIIFGYVAITVILMKRFLS